jgi:hypothetical protein
VGRKKGRKKEVNEEGKGARRYKGRNKKEFLTFD